MTAMCSVFCLLVVLAVSMQSVLADCPSCSAGTSCNEMRAYALCLATKTTSAGCNTIEAAASSALKSTTEAAIRVGCTGAGLMSSIAIITLLNVIAYFGRKLV